MIRVAILVDEGYYRKRANRLFGQKTAAERATELEEYCKNIFFKIKLELIYIEYSTMIIHLAIKIYITLFYKGI